MTSDVSAIGRVRYDSVDHDVVEEGGKAVAIPDQAAITRKLETSMGMMIESDFTTTRAGAHRAS